MVGYPALPLSQLLRKEGVHERDEEGHEEDEEGYEEE